MKFPHIHWFKVVREAPQCDYTECRCGERRINRIYLGRLGYQPIDLSWPTVKKESVSKPR
jgi:hypothetical protein